MPGLVRIRSLQAFRSADGAWHEGSAWFLVNVARALELREAGSPLADEIDANTAEPPGAADVALLQAAFAPATPVEDAVEQAPGVAPTSDEPILPPGEGALFDDEGEG